MTGCSRSPGSEHPDEVTLPHWRALVTEVLDAARRTTYDPVVTLDTVLVLLEGGRGPELAEATAADRGLTPVEATAYGGWHDKFPARVLSAAIAVAAVDSDQFRASWSWPEGTRLTADDSWTLPLDSVVAEVLEMVRDGDGADKAYAELREALEELHIDVREPLWLDHDQVHRPERPIGSFTARQGLTTRLVIVTDRKLHVFRDPQSARLTRLLRPTRSSDPSVELRKRMLTVWQGDTTDQVLTLAAHDVRRARLGPATGGLWWRLTLTGTDGTVVLRGRGDGHEQEAQVREWLGDRVERSWLGAAPVVRSLRNAVGLAGTILGTLALVWGVLLTAVSPEGMPQPLPAVLAIGGFAALVVALLPDMVLDVVHRIRRQRLSEPLPPV